MGLHMNLCCAVGPGMSDKPLLSSSVRCLPNSASSMRPAWESWFLLLQLACIFSDGPLSAAHFGHKIIVRNRPELNSYKHYFVACDIGRVELPKLQFPPLQFWIIPPSCGYWQHEIILVKQPSLFWPLELIQEFLIPPPTMPVLYTWVVRMGYICLNIAKVNPLPIQMCTKPRE